MPDVQAYASIVPDGYQDFLEALKARISSARIQASLAVNAELVKLYFEIGREIITRQEREGWGAGVTDRLARDLRATFPDMKGFSPRNLRNMRRIAEYSQAHPIWQQLAAKLPWGHILLLVNRGRTENEARWYATKAIEHGWSRAILDVQIESQLFERQEQAPKATNIPDRLPAPQSDMALAMLKDPYIFDFLSIGEEAQERDLERALVDHITQFLLELGAGFAYLGRQVHLEVEEEDFYLDLLFYHVKLRCYVVVELKAGDFKPEYAGKLNFYCAAVDEQMRHAQDNPTIGLLLCKNKKGLLAEYTLRSITTPLAVSGYQLTRAIPDTLKSSLPSVEEIERELKGKD